MLHWRQLDDAWVVFDEASGDTHQISALGVSVLGLLADGARSRQELENEIVDATSAPAGEVASALESVVEQFKSLGLIETTTE